MTEKFTVEQKVQIVIESFSSTNIVTGNVSEHNGMSLLLFQNVDNQRY